MRDYLVRVVLGLLCALVVLGHVSGWITIPYFDRLEHITYDTRLRLTMSGEVDPRIVIVDIDERSLAAEGQWPWGRAKIARLTQALIDDYYADIVGYDILFAEPQASHDLERLEALAADSGDRALLDSLAPYRDQLDQDRVLAEVLDGRRVILGYFLHTDPGFEGSVGALPLPAFLGDGSDLGLYAPRATGYTGNLQRFQEVALGAGYFSNPMVDSDGIYRRIPLLHENGGDLYESLSLAVARHYLGFEVLPGFVEGSGDQLLLEYLEIGPLRVPVDPNGSALVPFAKPSPGFPYVSATDVINGTLPDPDVLAGSIVLIGTSAAALVDLRPTPVENVYPGVEIHANAITGILDERIKSRPSYTVAAETLVVLAFGLLGAFILPLLSPVVASMVTWVLIGAAIGVNMYLWQQGQILPLVSNLTVLLALYSVNMFYGFFFESRTRAQLRGLFGQYVPPELVAEMSDNPGSYTLDSRRAELTVLFTDVRGFTTISESLSPEELADLMNEFLTPMTQIVHANRGTIDKYMGDAMMAFWGAPVADPEHATHAVAAAIEMIRRLGDLQRTFDSRGWPEVRIGIGLNTGPMNVGNMGSEFRMAYTVLGDAVNLGSRLEGITKQYGVDIIVSESTARAAPEFLYRKLDLVRVKGKTEPIEIYQAVCALEHATPVERERAELLARAIASYRAGDWGIAEEGFQRLATEEPKAMLHRIYLDRIAAYRLEPPGDDWDGVCTFDTK